MVIADGARWIRSLVRRRCPNARWVMDPFHVVAWMNDALDEVRRCEWRAAKGAWDAARPARSRPGRPSRGDETPAGALALKEAADGTRMLTRRGRWPQPRGNGAHARLRVRHRGVGEQARASRRVTSCRGSRVR